MAAIDEVRLNIKDEAGKPGESRNVAYLTNLSQTRSIRVIVDCLDQAGSAHNQKMVHLPAGKDERLGRVTQRPVWKYRIVGADYLSG
jgi:hypothetical protein